MVTGSEATGPDLTHFQTSCPVHALVKVCSTLASDPKPTGGMWNSFPKTVILVQTHDLYNPVSCLQQWQARDASEEGARNSTTGRCGATSLPPSGPRSAHPEN